MAACSIDYNKAESGTQNHDQKIRLIQLIAPQERIKSDELESHFDSGVNVVGLLRSLAADGLINMEKHSVNFYELTEAGKDVLVSGSPEMITLRYIRELDRTQTFDPKTLDSIMQIGWGYCLRLGWIKYDRSTKLIQIDQSIVDSNTNEILITDTIACELFNISGGRVSDTEEWQQAYGNSLLKRKLITKSTQITYEITKTENFTTDLKRPAGALTQELVTSGQWRNRAWKSYNLNARGKVSPSGYLHPLLKVRTMYTEIFLEMGFEEMPTNRFVEASFWNFDTLFQPQQHPARDAHDTFFMATPATTTDLPETYVLAVKNMHEHGGHGSIGWRYNWEYEEAQKNILRTHTTAVSARMLYQLGQEYMHTGIFTPKKYFSIDKVFRNEAVDATHLAEFHQIEGLVADRNLTLGNLMGVLRSFFHKLGITNLRFKPAYNPYTEPSMEVFSYHEGLKKWVEVGNSGVFRPEMLLPLGLPSDVVVIAWGLSLERPTMIKYGIQNIRDLVGHGLDLGFCQSFPIVRV